MTREEAIMMAVRRSIRLGELKIGGWSKIMIMMENAFLDSDQMASVRDHFRAVCRAYYVACEPPAQFYKGYRIRVNDGGHGPWANTSSQKQYVMSEFS